MRILRDTPDQLVLTHPPLWLAAVLVVATLGAGWVTVSLLRSGDWPGFAMIGSGAILCAVVTGVVARPVRVVFDRASQTVTVARFGAAGEVRPLRDVAGADVGRGRETFRAGERKGSRVVLRLADGTAVPLVEVYVTGRSAGRAAAAITRWIGQP